jgi:hypothetical protein
VRGLLGQAANTGKLDKALAEINEQSGKAGGEPAPGQEAWLTTALAELSGELGALPRICVLGVRIGSPDTAELVRAVAKYITTDLGRMALVIPEGSTAGRRSLPGPAAMGPASGTSCRTAMTAATAQAPTCTREPTSSNAK